MIHHLDKTHCNPHAFYEGEKQVRAGDLDIFLPTLHTLHTLHTNTSSLAGFLRHKVPDS